MLLLILIRYAVATLVYDTRKSSSITVAAVLKKDFNDRESIPSITFGVRSITTSNYPGTNEVREARGLGK